MRRTGGRAQTAGPSADGGARTRARRAAIARGWPVWPIVAQASGELLKASRLLGWRRDTIAPHRPPTNGMAPRHVLSSQL
eukprot:2964976-Pyramimonas_sp.AAC.1